MRRRVDNGQRGDPQPLISEVVARRYSEVNGLVNMGGEAIVISARDGCENVTACRATARGQDTDKSTDPSSLNPSSLNQRLA